MPELPEVETVARQLAPLITGKRITGIRIHDPKLKQRGLNALKGYRVYDVYRLGKQVVIEFARPRANSPSSWLAVHLRMTGRLIFEPVKTHAKRDDKHLRAVFNLTKGQLGFHDVRRFGTFKLATTRAELEPAGLDPTTPAFTPARLGDLIAGSRTPIKTWLLRQDKLTGMGNIYASEACFGAGLHPEREAGALCRSELSALTRSTKRVLKAAIKHCGTTFSDFQDAVGETGGYVKYLKVYGRAGEPCRKCKTHIERSVQAQRSTFHCPRCQPFDGG